MARYSRRGTQRKRRSPRRTLRRRRNYAKRGPRRYKRYSRYPRRVAGPSNPPKRYARAQNWKHDTSPGSSITYAFRIDKTVPFDTYEDTSTSPATLVQGVRQYAAHQILFPSQGDDMWQRLGNRLYCHGFRFTFTAHQQFHSQFSWVNGYLHMCIIQMHDTDNAPSTVKPSFSVPIGEPENDDDGTYIDFDVSSINRSDAAKGKLRNPDWNVITHRKFFIGRKTYDENRWFNKDMQFYLPIKKSVQFNNSSDLNGTKPFYILMYWMPMTNRHDTATTQDTLRYIDVDHFRYVTYYKNLVS